ncbi:MAG: biotin--[acetyl-CoA-carboxylase] ligase, partial [Pseudomonadota bacterium]|nr:biotin--[acetyl-CoA-carboxylase] ligase [Pseudomonadota bacterium]
MNEIKKNKYNSYKEVVVLAQRQTQGRGRRNNTWISDKGNLFLSIRLKQRIKKNHHLLTYMFSIVLYDAVKKYIPKPIKQFIKWPNDIYVNKKKISGILIEFLSFGNNINDIIVGIGVNINNNPKNLNKSSTYLKKYSNYSIENIDFTKSILLGMNYWLKILNNNKSTILKEW